MMAPPQSPPAPPAPAAAEPPSKAERWLTVATAPDTDRLRRLPFAWTDGLRDARARFASAVREEGDLLRPDAALARVARDAGWEILRFDTLHRRLKIAAAVLAVHSPAAGRRLGALAVAGRETATIAAISAAAAAACASGWQAVAVADRPDDAALLALAAALCKGDAR